MTERGNQRGGGGASAANAGRYLGHGLTWVGATLLFLLAGQQLDRWVGTEPLFTLLGAFVGAAAGFWSMYYHLVVEPAKNERETREPRAPKDQGGEGS
ncbi:MAG TPA: AtpZ/AtpI family protein [Longimicrobiales bacterium]|nr:AtpZ/AtpI family protein [Longimicrobiales bacterium]